MVLSLATVPRRLVLVAAKLMAIATTAGAGALVSALAALLIVLGVRTPGAHGIGNPASSSASSWPSSPWRCSARASA